MCGPDLSDLKCSICGKYDTIAMDEETGEFICGNCGARGNDEKSMKARGA